MGTSEFQNQMNAPSQGNCKSIQISFKHQIIKTTEACLYNNKPQVEMRDTEQAQGD